MIFKVDVNSNVPIYLQIYDNVVSAIASGNVSEGYILPSARRVARDLGINYHTANKAYNLLQAEGFVIVRKKRTIVVNGSSNDRKKEFISKWQIVQIEMIKEAKAKGVGREDLTDVFCSLVDSLFTEGK